MAITETMYKNTCRMALNDGTDSEGNVKSVNVSLGTMSDSGWDASKAYAIADAIESCLTKTVLRLEHVQTNIVRNT